MSNQIEVFQPEDRAREDGAMRREETMDLTRARAREEAIGSLETDDPKTKRVIWCLRELAAGRWIPGDSHIEGAERFKVSPRTIENDVAEASRIIRIMVLGEEELRAMCVTALQRAMQMAEKSGGAAGAQALAKSVQVMSELHGFNAAKRIEVDAGRSLADILKLGVAQAGDEE